jgi:hypothetical protein
LAARAKKKEQLQHKYLEVNKQSEDKQKEFQDKIVKLAG